MVVELKVMQLLFLLGINRFLKLLQEERYGGGRISAEVGGLEQEVKRIMNPVVVEEEERIPPAESWLERFEVNWVNLSQDNKDILEKHDHSDYLFHRGFDPKILEQWQIGYDEMSERITIPIRDNLGNLVGFKGRANKENTIPRYMILGDYGNQKRYGFQPYKKSHYVFGLDNMLIAGEERFSNEIVVEGELNVIALEQHGFGSIGIAGSEFSDIQSKLIIEYCDSVILFLDNDKAGNKGTKKVIEMLSPYMPIKIVQNAAGDAAELDTKTVRDLINNAESSLVLQAAGKI
jgi:5S rRNA maturation endonuclease (ribonuclease M5)